MKERLPNYNLVVRFSNRFCFQNCFNLRMKKGLFIQKEATYTMAMLSLSTHEHVISQKSDMLSSLVDSCLLDRYCTSLPSLRGYIYDVALTMDRTFLCFLLRYKTFVHVCSRRDRAVRRCWVSSQTPWCQSRFRQPR